MLRQIDYFRHSNSHNQDEFLDELHYQMKEEFFETGTEILAAGEDCTAIHFVVQGKIELQIFNSVGEKFVLATLRQGDVLGQYSILFNESHLFTTVAATNVRLLKIDQDFFLEN